MASQKIHFVGIGGISLSALAIILHKHNYIVSGSDTTKSNITDTLQKQGITVYIGHNKQNVQGANLVVYSSAIKPDNPEIKEALSLGITVIKRAELLGAIANNYNKVISVSGSHGKTTVTGIISSIFLYAKKNPTIHIGGNLPIIDGNVKVGSKQYFITEACEYCDSFLHLKSYASVVLNIQKDHLDYFKNISNLYKSFKNYIKNTNANGFVVLNNDDEYCKKINTKALKITYAINNKAHLQAKNIKVNNKQQYSYDLFVCGKKLTNIKLSIFGKHNIYNSLAAIAVALQEDIDIKTIAKAIKKYKSSERRFELVSNKKAKIINDYAHHPTEILATINTAKQLCKGKLVVVFQPHTFSRTKHLWRDFITCFNNCDNLILCPIYPAREEPIKNITSDNLAKQIAKQKDNVQSAKSLLEAYNLAKPFDKKGNVILIMGAGTIQKLVPKFKSK